MIILRLNVEPTARPLVINVDYNEATFQITKDIQSVMSGMRQRRKFIVQLRNLITMHAEKLYSGQNQKRRKTGQHMNPDLQQLEG